MKDYLIVHPWKIVEEGFHPEENKVTESIFSLGNGRFGQRANFEEYFSGETLQGNYVGGVYYPDKTLVGWWKNGYPEYYAKVLNSANWNFIDIYIDDERLDLEKSKILYFYRELDMQEGVLRRRVKLEMKNGIQIELKSERLNSLEEKELGLIRYSVKLLNSKAIIRLEPQIDFDVRNEDSNYDENFWTKYHTNITDGMSFISANTKKTDFKVGLAQSIKCYSDSMVYHPSNELEDDALVGLGYDISLGSGEEITIEKYVSILSSLNHKKEDIQSSAFGLSRKALEKGYDYYLKRQKEIWASKWDNIDIQITGDKAAQQGIRFNIFHLHQTYSGDDYRLNIGPKGFTGERYGGSTYWDTEAYCLPFYMSTADEEVGKALLIYRYQHLEKAIENAAKLGFNNGAALYPMVTMNGEECHNEWEITFEEIHRNGAIAYAIYDYINYTGDSAYLGSHGLEVLIAISRFWKQRVHFSERRKKYVMMGVTGPNEYENNVNNNWYTNYIACWTLRYTLESISHVKNANPSLYKDLVKKIGFNENLESEKWVDIIDRMYYPYDEELDIYLQQDNYLDKEQILVQDLDKKHLPLNQNWSWDRILRSCFIKQADVLQGFFFFKDEFSTEALKKNFLFYEPRTVHESSLSPCIHSILASDLGMKDKAYEMYLRTARLDLNDYNNDTEDGLHITSMAGTWMSIVKGFGGMEVKNGVLHFNPKLPKQWDSYNFKIQFRGHTLKVKISSEETKIINLVGEELLIVVSDKKIILKANGSESILAETA